MLFCIFLLINLKISLQILQWNWKLNLRQCIDLYWNISSQSMHLKKIIYFKNVYWQLLHLKKIMNIESSLSTVYHNKYVHLKNINSRITFTDMFSYIKHILKVLSSSTFLKYLIKVVSTSSRYFCTKISGISLWVNT